MTDHILITGGAGLIGSHLEGERRWRGHRARALDFHGPHGGSKGAASRLPEGAGRLCAFLRDAGIGVAA